MAERRIRMRYFASAAEAAGPEEETVSTTAATTGELRLELAARFGPAMARVLDAGSLLVDGVVRRAEDAVLGDAVDVLPPFAGG